MSKIDPTGLSDMSLFPFEDPIRQYDANIPSISGYFSVGAHGNPSEIGNQNNNSISAAQLAGLIRGDARYRESSIQLNSCSTGSGRNSFAQQLSNELGVSVMAPGGDLMMFRNGGTNVMNGNGWINFTPSRVPFR